tara:strand:+ start:264 stop:527 length:264 start_codon:yes stop_codon:yes gene_type:complete
MKIPDVLNIDVKEPIELDSGEELSLYEMSRWSILIQGVDLIEKKARQLKINLNKNKTWLKPLALQKYIEEETPSMIARINQLKKDEE